MEKPRGSVRFDGPNMDVLVDLCHPLLNRVVDGFIKVDGVSTCFTLFSFFIFFLPFSCLCRWLWCWFWVCGFCLDWCSECCLSRCLQVGFARWGRVGHNFFIWVLYCVVLLIRKFWFLQKKQTKLRSRTLYEL